MKVYLRFTRVLILATMLAIFSIGCNNEGTNLNLDGKWAGDWRSSITRDNGNISGILTQNGNTISGEVVITGSPCFEYGNVSGEITGSTVRLTLTSSQSSIAFSAANATSTIMRGKYEVKHTGTICDGDKGVFTIIKQ